ncbi:MAG: hypothetical protein SPK18_10350 [Treponema sp.]|nr:hypothetical protein [Treponema sp.]MDY5758967.1 hypothetical protein [Treponema sp.]
MRKLYFYFCAWDKACELYAQLTGLVTDYGVEHFARCGHLRYGRADYDYSFKGWFL